MTERTHEELERAIAHIGDRYWLARLLHYPMFAALVLRDVAAKWWREWRGE